MELHEMKIYDTATLFETMSQMETPPSFFLNLGFKREHLSTSEWIQFEQIEELRKAAPFVMPTVEGKPIAALGSTVKQMKAGYIKIKDGFSASEFNTRKQGIGELVKPIPLTPKQRYDAFWAHTLRQHFNAVHTTLEIMAKELMTYGRVTLEGDDYQKRVVDFGRDPRLTITLTGNELWTDTNAKPLDKIDEVLRIIHRAKFTGTITHLILGLDAWEAIRDNPQVKDLLDKNYNHTQFMELNRGIGDGSAYEFKGNFSSTLKVYTYRDYYEKIGTNGEVEQVEFMDPKHAILYGPRFNGVRCFGTIQDFKANLSAVPIFSKMFDQEDPSNRFLLTQSAPLLATAAPNNTALLQVVE